MLASIRKSRRRQSTLGKPGYERFKFELLERYQLYQDHKPLGYKSMALASDIDGQFVYVYERGSNSYGAGRNWALNKCKERRKDASIQSKCVVFSQGNRIVLEYY